MEKKNKDSRAVALLKEKLESNLRDYRNDWLTLPSTRRYSAQTIVPWN